MTLNETDETTTTTKNSTKQEHGLSRIELDAINLSLELQDISLISSSDNSLSVEQEQTVTPSRSACEDNHVDVGIRMAHALNDLLAMNESATASLSIKDNGDDWSSYTVDSKDRENVNLCFAPGNPEPEFTGSFADSNMRQDLQSLVDMLEQSNSNRRSRSLVVDNRPSTSIHLSSNEKGETTTTTTAMYIEDSLWLSLPRWQTLCNKNKDDNACRLIFCVVTVRSLERSVFRHAYNKVKHSGWKMSHHGSSTTKQQDGGGPRGTCYLQHETTGCQALFSDQPGVIARRGLELAVQHPDKYIVRVLRCAPRESLCPYITAVLEQSDKANYPNMIDLWIRHTEIPTHSSRPQDRYTYTHPCSANLPVLQLLTDITPIPPCEDEPNGATSLSLEHDESALSNSFTLGVASIPPTGEPAKSAFVSVRDRRKSFSDEAPLPVSGQHKKAVLLCWSCREVKRRWAFAPKQADKRACRRCRQCMQLEKPIDWRVPNPSPTAHM